MPVRVCVEPDVRDVPSELVGGRRASAEAPTEATLLPLLQPLRNLLWGVGAGRIRVEQREAREAKIWREMT